VAGSVASTISPAATATAVFTAIGAAGGGAAVSLALQPAIATATQEKVNRFSMISTLLFSKMVLAVLAPARKPREILRLISAP
jgi:hypothetical protein